LKHNTEQMQAIVIWSIDRSTGLRYTTCGRTTFTASIEARADRSLGQTQANLHSVVHVRLTETVRILRHCKPTEKEN